LLPLETTPDPRSQEGPFAPRTKPIPRGVDELMTSEVYTVDEDTDLAVVSQRMLEANVKRFPVMRGARVVGIVSRHDLVRVIARTDADVETGVTSALTEEGHRLTSLDVRGQRGGLPPLRPPGGHAPHAGQPAVGGARARPRRRD